ncbi:SAM hydrolase/SAM-dependent halogenase family protein [Sneathiella glossodoripedis]|uniref:SAM hydrolase/SAM-dependent halogenase family protein n=1 Tax=Sneathiella glossodoripedis TaxID=418853 RepID=UPI0004727D02|nr:SAM-dependent chlorinase/fluorinase [Sneathiella glossodoripedis]
MIVLFTDFGSEGPYQGQMIASARKHGFKGDIVTLFADAPAFSVKYSARLLEAYYQDFPENSVFLCIIDPGVGSSRKPLIIKSCNRWFVGPDNGLFEYLLRLDKKSKIYEISWVPEKLSASFHGRDLFAPVAAELAQSQTAKNLGRSVDPNRIVRTNWSDSIAEIIYIDHYGNCMTGIAGDANIKELRFGDQVYPISRTFSDVAVGAPLVYVNANNLVEIAVNQGRADQCLSLRTGATVKPIGLD